MYGSMPAPRVLIVDSDLAHRIVMVLMLQTRGYVPRAVASVDRALELLERDGADLVITELVIAGRSSTALLAALCDGREVPALAMTSSEAPALERVACALGVRTILRKPVDGEQLETALNEALVRADSARDLELPPAA